MKNVLTSSFRDRGSFRRRTARASATIRGETEDFLWDGLALVKRGKRGYMNEPHVGGGAPIATDDGVVYFNDMLGSSIAATKGDKTAQVGMTSFGGNGSKRAFYTGKPQVEGLGYAFLMRNYRADLGKWQTADPMGYPDGWNQLAYCCNGVTTGVDLWGCEAYDPNGLTEAESESLYRSLIAWTTYAWEGYPFVAWKDKTYTLKFLTRYLFGMGDQTLNVGEISGNSGYSAANRKARKEILEGNRSFDIATIFSGDWYTALGRVSVHYEVIEYDTYYVAFASFEDSYDFHDADFNVYFDGLSLVGWIWGWEGGNSIRDVWMKNLYDYGWATEFKTKCEWVYYVQKE